MVSGPCPLLVTQKSRPLLGSATVLSNLVQIPNWGSILLDAGEGTWGQIARRFGSQILAHATESPAHQILRDIRCIFISHLHADHHMGLSKVLALRRKVASGS
jgi:ribonuclease Z